VRQSSDRGASDCQQANAHRQQALVQQGSDDGDQGAKRSRGGPLPGPSRSIYLGNCGEPSEADVLAACQIFGQVESVYLMPMKKTAFVNFVEEASAHAAMAGGTVFINGQPCRPGWAKTKTPGAGAPPPQQAAQPAMAYSMPGVDPNVAAMYAAYGMAVPVEAMAQQPIAAYGYGAEAQALYGAEAQAVAQVPPQTAPHRNTNHPHVGDIPSRSMYLGNIQGEFGKEDVQAAIQHFGEVDSIYILDAKKTAFVNFKEQECATAAMNAGDSIRLNGAPVRFGWAKSREDRGGGGGAAGPSSGACFKCGQPGHWARECPNVPGAPQPQAQQQVMMGNGSDMMGMMGMMGQPAMQGYDMMGMPVAMGMPAAVDASQMSAMGNLAAMGMPAVGGQMMSPVTMDASSLMQYPMMAMMPQAAMAQQAMAQQAPAHGGAPGAPSGAGDCFRCGQIGHWARDCPNPRSEQAAEGSRSIYLGNYQGEPTKEDVIAATQQFGTIATVHLLAQKKTAFVNFDDPAAAALAMQHAQSISILGHPVRVGWAKSR